MPLNSLWSADVPLRNHSLSHFCVCAGQHQGDGSTPRQQCIVGTLSAVAGTVGVEKEAINWCAGSTARGWLTWLSSVLHPPHTHPFNGPLSGSTRVNLYQKGNTNLDFTEARDSEWQWHQLSRMEICTSLQTDNHASTPPLSFLQARCPFWRPTNSVKALKALKVLHPTQHNIDHFGIWRHSSLGLVLKKLNPTEKHQTTIGCTRLTA